MKKLWIALCLILALTMALSPLCFAAEDNYDTLADWNIRIAVPEGASAVLKGSEYYIYAQKTGSIPYVMLRTYKYSSVEKFVADFTAYMQKEYADLEVVSEAAPKSIGARDGYEVVYGYEVSGNAVKDRRFALYRDGLVYLFTSKEVEARGMTVGNMLDEVVANCRFLDEPEDVLEELEEDTALASAYLYCEDNGMPKYWLDLSGAMTDALALHCYFRSGDPTFYESVFFLDLATADIEGECIDVHTVTDSRGFDHSNWFKTLQLRIEGDKFRMTVERDEKTLAGGSEDNILTGTYLFEPARAGLVYEYRRDNGMLKYWLDSNGEDVLLHAMFISGEPEYYEEVFTLDTETAQADGPYTVSYAKVLHQTGADVSNWFKSLTLSEVQGAILMNVRRDESTLAGGEGDNILTGVYLFEPHTYLLPAGEGPFTEDELGRWAQIYYFRQNGFFPPEVEVKENADGSLSIHLFEIAELDGTAHTATSAWYTVDRFGVGTNDITGKAVSLCR